MDSVQLTDIELAHALVALQSPMQLLKRSDSGKPRLVKAWLSDDFQKLRWSARWRQTEMNIADMVAFEASDGSDGCRSADSNQFLFKLQYVTTCSVASSNQSMSPSRRSVSYSTATLSTVSESIHPGVLYSLEFCCQDVNDWVMWVSVLGGLHNQTISEAILERARELSLMKQSGGSSSMLSKIHDDSNQVYSWGDGNWGATAHGDLSTRTKPEIVKGAVGKGVLAVSCGWAHTVFLLESGEIWASGHSLGTGAANDSCNLIKLEVAPKIDIVQIVCGSYHCLARSACNTVLSWGAANYGQLGLGDTIDRSSPTPIEGVVDVITVACGSNASAFICMDGSVYTFGQGDSGFTGHGHDCDLNVPTALLFFGPSNPATNIACGANHMVALTKDSIYSWGWNACGQLGQGHTNDVWVPTKVSSLSSLARGRQQSPRDPSAIAIDLSCGDAHSAIILHDTKADQYQLFTWGMNSSGQCGLHADGDSPFVVTPKLVHVPISPTTMLSVSCGAHHTLLLTKQHGPFSAGSNECGQLGIDSLDRDPVFELRPCRVSSKGVISQIAAGNSHCCMILSESWVDDSDCTACMACKSSFTRFRRRHHCRSCGGIFCSACSDNRVPILRKGLTSPVRVCASCFVKLSR